MIENQLEGRRVFGTPSENPEDYLTTGTFTYLVAGEDIPFKAEVELRAPKTIYLFEGEEREFQNLGTAMESIPKGKTGKVLLNGFMIRKGEEANFKVWFRVGLAESIGHAITEAFLSD